jgi:ankyrin repeat protein
MKHPDAPRRAVRVTSLPLPFGVLVLLVAFMTPTVMAAECSVNESLVEGIPEYLQADDGGVPQTESQMVQVTKRPPLASRFVSSQGIERKLPADVLARGPAIEAAIEADDVSAFLKAMPSDPAKRQAALKAHAVPMRAFQVGALSIVKQLLRWDRFMVSSYPYGGPNSLLESLTSHWQSTAQQMKEDEEVVAPATTNNRVELVKLLLTAGANPATGKSSWEPLEQVASIPASPQVLEVARLFLDLGANINKGALANAAEQGNADLVSLMLQKQTPSQEALDQALMRVRMREVNLPLITQLLAKGANINAAGMERAMPLLDAAYEFQQSGKRQLVQLLVQHKAAPDPYGGQNLTALMAVITDPELVLGMLSNGANPNKRTSEGETALLYLASIPAAIPPGHKGKYQPQPYIKTIDPHTRAIVIAHLLRYGADPNQVNPKGYTPLMRLKNLDAESTDLLLSHGARFGRPTQDPFTPQRDAPSIGDISWALMYRNDALAAYAIGQQKKLGQQDCGAMLYAAQVGATRTIGKLLDMDVNPNTASGLNGETPLIMAAANGELDAVKLLLDRKAAKVDERTPRRFHLGFGHSGSSTLMSGGETALMMAARQNQVDVMAELIRRGANVKATDYAGASVLDHARGSRHATQMLSLAGAK